MSKNISEIPFTEICERIQDVGRVPDSARAKIRASANEVYVREIPYKHDWDFLIASSAVITSEPYDTGTVSVTTGSTTATFASATITTSMKGCKIKVSGNDVVYDFNYSDSTGGTLSPSFQGTANASGNSYSIFFPIYALASDFERFPKDGGVYKWVGGQKEIMKEEPYQEYSKYFQATPSEPDKVRLVSTNSAGIRQFEFRPAPNQAKVYGYDYIKQLKPLSETTAGTVTIVGNSTTVTGTTSCRFSEATTGDYLRIDAFGTGDDSTWYRIATISNDSSITLSSTFSTSGATNANYTISKVPDIPVKLHQSIVWGSLRTINTDQNDQNALYYVAKYKEGIDEARKLFVTRTYSQEVRTVAEEYMYRR